MGKHRVCVCVCRMLQVPRLAVTKTHREELMLQWFNSSKQTKRDESDQPSFLVHGNLFASFIHPILGAS